MIKDYHLHPQVLTKPDQIHEFVKVALDRGIDELCLTDHIPLTMSNARDRIPAGRVEEYCKQVRRLAKEYENSISIKLGVEIDYHPSIQDEMEAVLKAGDYDFVVGASHLHVVPANTFDNIHTYTEFAYAMLENTIKAAQSGYFDSVAHIQFFKWHFTKPERFPLTDDGFIYEMHLPLIEKVLDTYRDTGVRLELNTHLFTESGNISEMDPDPMVVNMALEKGVKFVLASDAHKPHGVGGSFDILRAHPVYGKAVAQWESER